jgi:DNA-binding MarR family transcriptional regulator
MGAKLPRASDPTADVTRTLAITSRLLEKSLADMTLPQFRILLLVARSPERANRLASQASISRPSLTGVLDGLVAREWVRRVEVDGDRRGVTLEVTAAGRKALAVAQRAVAGRVDELLGQLDPDRRATAVAGLEALGEAIDLDLTRRLASRGVTGPKGGRT